MKLLVLGGTVFLGRHIVEHALRCGHDVTLLNRGISNPGLFPALEHIAGSRNDVATLTKGRRFDAIIDVSGYLPEEVALSARALDHAEIYAFLSSIAVYRELGGQAEESASLRGPASSRQLSGSTLGPLKAECEQSVRHVFGDRALVLRAGLLVGSHDIASRARGVGGLDYDAFSPRFPYWPLRFSQTGPVLGPGRQTACLQVLDARDLAVWLLAMVERKEGGTFNTTGSSRTMLELLTACAQANHHNDEIVWVDDAFLLRHKVGVLVEMPFWIPQGAPIESLMQVPSNAARQHGFATRPLADTVAEVLEWAVAHSQLALSSGTPVLSGQREQELLALWRQCSNSGSEQKFAGSPTKTPTSARDPR